MRTEQIICLNRGRSKGEDCGHVKSILFIHTLYSIHRLYVLNYYLFTGDDSQISVILTIKSCTSMYVCTYVCMKSMG